MSNFDARTKLSKARYLPVMPLALVEHYAEKSPQEFPLNNLFLLAHEVLKEPARWSAALARLRNKFHLFTILDNSVVELGDSVSHQMILDAIALTNPDVFVLPDVLEKGYKTLVASGEFLEKFYECPLPSAPLFIPQGATLTDWIETLDEFHTVYPQVSWIGIPRNATGRIVKSRKELVAITDMIYKNPKIHLMGFSDNITDDLLTARTEDSVISIDSNVPLRLAFQHKRFCLTADPGPRGNWESELTRSSYMQQYHINIQRVEEYLQ